MTHLYAVSFLKETAETVTNVAFLTLPPQPHYNNNKLNWATSYVASGLLEIVDMALLVYIPTPLFLEEVDRCRAQNHSIRHMATNNSDNNMNNIHNTNNTNSIHSTILFNIFNFNNTIFPSFNNTQTESLHNTLISFQQDRIGQPKCVWFAINNLF